MKNGVVTIAGAGPGAVDLLTLRCRQAVEEADVIVYAGSLVNPEILNFARADTEFFDSSSLNLDEILEVMIAAVRADKKVLRLHTGDPSVYGATAEQMRRLEEAGVEYEVIPGVTSLFAAAAAVKCELTVPGHSQSVIVSRRAGRTPVPAGEEITSLAAHGATMALYLSVADIDGLVRDLNQGGYPESTPVAVVYRASWPDELVVRGSLADIAGKIKEQGIGRQAIVLVGDSLAGEGDVSRLYDAAFSHGYRRAGKAGLSNNTGDTTLDNRTANAESRDATDAECRPAFSGSVAVFALTSKGVDKARLLGKELGADIFVPQAYKDGDPGKEGDDKFSVLTFAEGEFKRTVTANWDKYNGHIFLMATGIVIRETARLLKNKTVDPAVVVCDEAGNYAISLLSGHIGGANRLAGKVADVLGGQAVVTTATDSRGITAFDDLASRNNLEIVNPEMIKELNTMLLQDRSVAVWCPEGELEGREYAGKDNVTFVEQSADIPAETEGIVMVESGDQSTSALSLLSVPVLRLRPKTMILGIGCRQGTSEAEIEKAVAAFRQETGLNSHKVKTVATIDLKENETGLLNYAKNNDVQLKFYSASDLAEIEVPNPSKKIAEKAGTGSVCEAAAIVAG
ncbi:MAG: precorrin-4 C(11)-methyltransferase, partial [Verrucomicrobiota bacterium]